MPETPYGHVDGTAPIGHRPLVLVIEDEPTQRSLLTRVLEREGYDTLGIGNGEMGLRAIVEYAPAMVLLDLSLPGMDGFEICRRLRAEPVTATLPVIVITAHTAMEDMVAALDAGADDFLAKPVQQMELLARIRSAMRLRRAITSLERATQIVAALANAVEAKDVGPRPPLPLAGASRGARRREPRPARRGARGGGLRRAAPRRGQDRRARAPAAQGRAAVRRRVEPDAPPPGDRRAHLPAAARVVSPSRRSFATTTSASTAAAIRTACVASRYRSARASSSIADAYEAMVHGRPYQPAQAHERVRDELVRLRGKQFDPELVPVFLDELERDTQGVPPLVALPQIAILEREAVAGA